MSASARRRPVMLVVLDGWGWRTEAADNAVRQAKPAVFERLWATSPHAFLNASGRDVGLPDGQIGNSEVGHLNIGAGRVVMQELPRIDAAIESGELGRAAALVDFIAALRTSRSTCHLMGLVSPGGVHSHQRHALALARALAAAHIPARLHIFLDGRDTSPKAAGADLPPFLKELPDTIAVGSVSGRYFAMDRDHRWDRIEKAYLAIAEAKGPRSNDAPAAVEAAYAANISDEFVPPTVIGDYDGMHSGDGVLCFNFRADRVREILAAILDPRFSGFARPRKIAFAAACGMAHYSAELDSLLSAILPPLRLEHVLGEVVANAGRTQLRMAETEKYAHVTYFLNGGREEPFAGEDRILVPSPKVATYDLQPEMSAPELTDKAVAAIEACRHDLIVLNYANPDMVGHTGDMQAAIRAVQAADQGLGRIEGAMAKVGGRLLVTADHGNCELMRDPSTGGPHTAHTTDPVPVLLVGAEADSLADGRLADIAPTLLQLMGLPQPAEMTGRSLIRPHAKRATG